jgi:hypothetical protein
MKILADLAKLIGMLLAVFLLIPLLLTVLAYVGYFYGIILSWLAGGILAGSGFVIDSYHIPNVLAWGFVGIGAVTLFLVMFAGDSDVE